MDKQIQKLMLPVAQNHRLAAACFTLIVSIFLLFYYFRLLAGVSTFFIADHCYYFEPFTHFIGTAMAAGRLPLWNPYLYCGMAQAAVPSPGMFYPPNLLFAWLSYSQALALILLFSQVIACLGGFLLIYSFGWGMTAATVAGITLGMCGYMFSLSTNYTLVAGASWLPLMLWSFRRIKLDLAANLSKPYFACVLCVVTTFMLVAAGRPEVFVPGCLINLLAIVFDALTPKQEEAPMAAQLKWQLTAFAAAILLTMPIVLPVVEWVNLSPRSHGLNLSQTLMWSVNWYDIVSLLFAYPFGDLQLLGAHHLSLVATRPVFLPYVPSNYIGPIVFTAAIWSFAERQWKFKKVLLAYSICVLIACLGEYTPVMPTIMQTVPALTMFRYPIKWMIYLILALVLAAGRGTYLLTRNKISKGGRVAACLIWAIAFVAAFFFLAMAFAKQELALAKPPLPVEAELWLGQSLLIGAALGAATCGLEWWHCRGKITSCQVALLFTAAVTLNLFVPACRFQQITTSPQFWRSGSFVQEAINSATKGDGKDKGRFLSLYFDPVWTPSDYRAKFDKRWTAAFFDYARNLILPNTNLDRQLSESFGYEAAETGPYRKLFFDILHQCSVCLPGGRTTDRPSDCTHYSDVPLFRFCQSTATSWVGTQAWKGVKPVVRLDERFFSLIKEDKKQNIRLYKVKSQLPRAYLSQYWRWCPGEKWITEAVSKADISKFNPCVISEIEMDAAAGETDSKGVNRYLGPLMPKAPESSPALADAVLHSQMFDRDPLIDSEPVAILTDEPEHLSLSVKADRACFLILTDHFYPGWQASIDGVKRACFRVNACGRAVYIPPGAHLIEFNYFPESLRLGFYLAAPGALFLIIMLLSALRPYIWSFLKKLAGQQ